MNLLRRNKPSDVIFLMPVKRAGERLPKDKLRMLYCDSEGKVYASLINKEVLKLAQESIEQMELAHREYATLGLEIGPGNFAPLVVEVGSQEVLALERILEHAQKSGMVPPILHKNIKQILKLGQESRQKNKRKKAGEPVITPPPLPEVLDRLPYYSEKDLEFSMPIYKASHAYPLVVLKRLPKQNHNSVDAHLRMLVLDNEGDLAMIKVPVKLIDRAEKRLDEWSARSGNFACLMVSRSRNGLDINYLLLSHAQKKALDTMARKFEETGQGEQPVSETARTVLTRARELVETA